MNRVHLCEYNSVKTGTIESNGGKLDSHQYGPQTVWSCNYTCVGEEGKRRIFSVGGVKVKLCGLEQFDPCNDRGLWYGSTCQRCASTDPCCSPLQGMWTRSSTVCHTHAHTQSLEKCHWVCPNIHQGSCIYWSWFFGLTEILAEKQTHFTDHWNTQPCPNVLLCMGPLAHRRFWKNA